MALDTYIRLALDSVGKRMRNLAVTVLQTGSSLPNATGASDEIGTSQIVYQEVVTRATDDGTILDTKAVSETGAEQQQRMLLENIYLTLLDISAAVNGGLPVASQPPTISLGE